MLADLTPIISRGVIDNTRCGVTELTLWCTGEEEPLSLRLGSDCLQDIAGCRVSFTILEKPAPSATQAEPLRRIIAQLADTECDVRLGDVTLSRKAPSAKSAKMLGNFLSIELFLDLRVRLLIESERIDYSLSLPEWECTTAHAAVQSILNMSTLRDHVLLCAESYKGPAITHAGEDMPPCRWDSILNHAEAFMSILPSICEKYDPLPRGLIAELFVMDRSDTLGRIADIEEQRGGHAARAHHSGWEILHFIPADEAPRVAKAMNHPLFEAAIKLTGIIHTYIFRDMEHYYNNPKVEKMIALLAGSISQLLGTILASQDPQTPPHTARARALTLISRLEAMKNNCHELRPQAAFKYGEGLVELIAELKNFVCTLRS